MSQKEDKTNAKKNSRNAMITFVSGAAVIYSAALYYCISTGNVLAAQLIGAAIAAISILTVFIYRSL